MQTSVIQYKDSKIHYAFSPTGKNPVICFHGYGESCNSFAFLEGHLPPAYKLICIDLPYHGGTEWKNGLEFQVQDLVNIIDQICKTEEISGQKFSLIGYSLGGRIALQLLEVIPSQIKKLILLAPDGIKLNFWYWLATQTKIGNRLFKLTMSNPAWFVTFLNSGNRLKLVNPSIHKFVKYYIHDNEVRRELYQRWTSMRKFKPSVSNIRKNIKEYRIPVRLVYGKHDRIIISSPAEGFIRGLHDAEIVTLDCGHQVLHSRNAKDLVNAVIN
jgi:pimeloyl-ACP methyl ester carboxylesterase